ncbi:DUF4398 domain-containing protein [Pseudomonas sp. Marseille-QA0892]
MSPTHLIRLAVLCVPLYLGGCATEPTPDVHLSLAQQAIAHADAAVAGGESDRLTLAREKFAQAQQHVVSDDFLGARFLAEQAAVDARVAELQALVQSEHKQSSHLRKQIAAARQELEALQ